MTNDITTLDDVLPKLRLQHEVLLQASDLGVLRRCSQDIAVWTHGRHHPQDKTALMRLEDYGLIQIHDWNFISTTDYGRQFLREHTHLTDAGTPIQAAPPRLSDKLRRLIRKAFA